MSTTTYAEIARIEKIEEQPDGALIVWGKCTDDSIDSDLQIVDPAFAAKRLPEWLATGGNIRVMHSPLLYPAGLGVELVQEDGAQWLRARIVEDTAKTLLKENVLTAYSVGIDDPKVVRDGKAKGGRVVDGTFVEVSLVDRPANASCKVDIVKSRRDGRALVTKIVKGVQPAGAPHPNGPVGDKDKPATDPINQGTIRCPLCNGTGLIREGHRRCPKCEGTGRIRGPGYIEKRQMDPNVGGGVDRDKLADEDFVFPKERSFPIVTPEDVSDAVSSWGRYRGTETFETFKTNLISLVRRKGEKFESELPEKWQKELMAQSSKRRKQLNDLVTQQEKIDSRWRRMNKGKDKDVSSVTSDLAEAALELLGDVTDLGVEEDPDGLRQGLEEVASDIQEIVDAGNELIPATIEDAMDAAQPPPLDILSLGKSYAVGRLHDVLCPVFSTKMIEQHYPVIAEEGLSSAVDPKMFADRSSQLLTVDGGTGKHAKAIVREGMAFAAAVQVAHSDKVALRDARDRLHKYFAQEYPKVDVKPGEVTPGQFQRPYIKTGRQPQKPGKAPRIPLQSHVPDPADFTRGPLTENRQAPVPGAFNPSAAAAITGTKKQAKVAEKQRQFYTNNARDQALQAMMVLHDYIQAAVPDVCPLGPPRNDPSQAGTTAVLDNGSTNTLVPKEKKPKKTKKIVKVSTAKIAKKYEKQIQDLTRSVAELQKQPDPAVVKMRRSPISKVQAVPAEDTKAATELAWLTKRAKSPNRSISAPALEELAKKVSPEQLVDLL